MVNFLSRFARRASSGSEAVDSSTNESRASAEHNVLPRSNSVSTGSPKQSQTRRFATDDRMPRRLILISDRADFDPRITHRFQAEGFEVTFIGFLCSGDSERDRKALENKVHEKEDELEDGERYAIVAYNRPAYYLLACHHLATTNTNPFPRLCALIAYYPLTSTDQWTRDIHPGYGPRGPACTSTASIFGPGPLATYLPIQIHLTGHEAKQNTIWPWIETHPYEEDTTSRKRHRCHVYAYPDAQPGFAEQVTDPDKNRLLYEQDQVSSKLAWSRAIGCLRRAFGVGENWAVVDIETVWEEYWQRLLRDLAQGKAKGRQGEGDGESRELESAVDLMVTRGGKHDGSFSGKMDLHEGEGPSVLCVPTKAGGSNTQTLRSFFTDIFIPNGPASQHLRLLSRTVGANQIVDEISFSFKHTADLPWLLPGVSPTNRDIEVVIVVVASFCANKIVRQKLYWDQASVLVQAGLLDPALVPQVRTCDAE